MNRRGARRPAPGPELGHGDLAASLVLIFPLLLAYEVGVLFAARVNGADLVSRVLFAACGGRRGAYLLVHAAVAVGFLLWLRRGRRWRSLGVDTAGPVVLEAAIYALGLGAVARLIVERLLGLGVGLTTVVGALGAGVHEELVFRLGAIGAGLALAGRAGVDRRLAVPLVHVAAALLFAAAHHVGAYGEPWTAHAFAFRVVAGLAFGAIFWWRSLAHAVYAHALYDLVVALGA